MEASSLDGAASSEKMSGSVRVPFIVCMYVGVSQHYRVYSHELEQLAHPSKVIVRWFVWRTNVTYVVCLWLMQLVNCGRFIL